MKGLIKITLIAFCLRLIAAIFIPVMGEDDSYTWWILSIETKHNDFIYTDPWKGHDKLFPPLYATVVSLLMAMFSSESIWIPRFVNILSGTFVVSMAYLIAREIIIKSDSEEKHQVAFWENAPLAGALLLAINPYHIIYTSTVGNEPLLCALLMVSIYFLLKTERTILYSCITAFFLLLASLTRYDAWLAIPFFIWIWLKQKRVTIPQFFVAFAIVMAGPMIWIWRQQIVFGSWRLFLDHYLSGGGASSASATGDPLLNGLFVITVSGFVTMGISWYAFYFGLKKIVSSGRGEPVKGPSPAIHLKNFGVVYGFFAFYVLGMALVAVLGLFPAWVRYHVGYLPTVFVIFSIVYAEKILPALGKPRGLIFSKKQISAGLVVLHLFFVFILLTPKHNRSLIEAGKVLAGSYEGGMILSDLPAFIYGTGLPVESFISSNDIPDDPSLWGDHLKSRNVKYLVWTSADYAKISSFEEGLLKNNKTGVKFAHIYSTDPNPFRKCHVYKVVDYGI